MTRTIILGIGFLLLLTPLTGNSFAANSPLTGADIEHFMDAMKPLQKLAKKYDMEEDPDGAANNMTGRDFSPMSRSLARIKDHEAYGEFKTIIRDAGFSSTEHWANVGDRVMKAYISLNISQEMTPEQKQEMRQSMAEIEKNEYLSPEMKKQLLANLHQTMTMMDNLSRSDKTDQETLKPYLPKLERLFEELE